MPKITFQGSTIVASPNQDLLSSLLDASFDIPFSCRNGVCQSCLMQAHENLPLEVAQKSLRDTLKIQNYFLACQCHPQMDMSVDLPNQAESMFSSKVLKISSLSNNVVELKLSRPDYFSYHAGQYVSLVVEIENEITQIVRCYSIANSANSDYLTFHIRLIKMGQFSNWLKNQAAVNYPVLIQGPIGDCFYVDADKQQDIVLVGTGTGLSPLQGILYDAIYANHIGHIDVFHGALNVEGIYNQTLLSQLALEHDNVNYHPCILNVDDKNRPSYSYYEGDLIQQIFKKLPSMTHKKVYICGDPVLVKQLKTQIFLAGANSHDIYADAFERSQKK